MGLLKIAVGGALMGILWYFTPLLLALEWFLYIILPLFVFFVAVGLISDGAYESFKRVPGDLEDLRQRVGQYRETRGAAMN